MAFQTKDEASAGGSQEHKLWGGRFRDGLDPLMEEFNASISFDRSVEKREICCYKHHQILFNRNLLRKLFVVASECSKTANIDIFFFIFFFNAC